MFIYNANKNRFAGNWFEGCDIGVHFTAGSERNEITDNAFVANHTQVMYVGTRSLDWSVNGRGNYWSDNPAFDLNGRRHRRYRLPAQRPHGPGRLASPGRQAAAEQPGRAGGALGAGAVSGNPSRRRHRQRAADAADRPAALTRMTAADERADRHPARRVAPLRQAGGGARRRPDAAPGDVRRPWSAITAPARAR